MIVTGWIADDGSVSKALPWPSRESYETVRQKLAFFFANNADQPDLEMAFVGDLRGADFERFAVIGPANVEPLGPSQLEAFREVALRVVQGMAVQ